MPRIPDDELSRLKEEIALERLVTAKGVKLKRHGQDLIGLCPFHDDKSPSLVVSPKKNLFNCLGACQTGGSVIDWVMMAEGVTFQHAVELLRADSPSLAAPSQARGPVKGKVAKRSSQQKLSYVTNADAEEQEHLRAVIEYYTDTLKQTPDALDYLQKRGLTHPEVIDRFKLGFSNRTLGYRLPAKNRQVGAQIRGALQSVGILRSSGHEHFRGSLVIPVINEAGLITEVYGRKITHNLRKGTADHLYLPGPHKGVWNLEAFSATDEIILCESLIDALTFWCNDYRNVTASYGLKGFTDEHLAALKNHSIKRVLIAYDRDDAGDKAATTLAHKLQSEGMACYRIEFPKGQDANEYALNVQPAAKSLGVAIRSAKWLGEGKRPSISARKQDTTPEPVKAQEPVPAPLPQPPAQVLPLPEPPQTPAEVTDNEILLSFGDRRWRVRGLNRNQTYDQLKVNLFVAKNDVFHIDTLDLYSARLRQLFTKQASMELGVGEQTLKQDLGKILLKLEELQDQNIKAQTEEPERVTVSEPDKEEALQLLQSPNLLDQILSDFEACGVVGEETNKLMGYIAASSRKLEQPLAVIVQSSSAAGKSSLMESILAFIPDEERVKYSAMTGQSLFYMGETNLQHKILAIVEEEGAEKASYALKLLQSEGELTIASTGKDPTTGRLITHEYRVEGPVMIFLTTTAIDIDEELLNRCVVLTVDENQSQTKAIHQKQRQSQTLEGLLKTQGKKAILRRHQNAQRLLLPLLVANPYAEQLTFQSDRTRTRRDHMKYLTLIRSIALLHQYQRPKKTILHEGQRLEYIEVTTDDIAMANELARPILGRSLDELPPQTRRFLLAIEALVTKECDTHAVAKSDYRFTRRQILDETGWGLTQVRLHLERLVALEYLVVHRGGRGQRFVYELLWNASRQPETNCGLTEVSTPMTANLAGGGGPLAASWRVPKSNATPEEHKANLETVPGWRKELMGVPANNSHTHTSLAAAGTD